MQKYLYALQVLRRRGLIFLWLYFRESVLFDLINGTKTSARVPKEEQTIKSSEKESSEGLLYVASFSSVVINTVSLVREYLGDDKFKECQFFDLGCGKGKALLVYLKQFSEQQNYPAIGIEYDPALAEIAQENAKICNYDKSRLNIVVDSAVNLLQFQEAEILIVYIYNSFQGKTFKEVLQTLSNVPHFLIYVDPVEKNQLSNYDYEILKENHGRYNADTWLVAMNNCVSR